MRLKIELAGEDLGVFDPDEVTMEQAMQLEDRTKLALGDLGLGMQRLSARSMQALVWLQRLRKGEIDPPLHANFKFGDLKVEDLPDEDPTPAAVTAAEAVTASGTGETSTSGS